MVGLGIQISEVTSSFPHVLVDEASMEGWALAGVEPPRHPHYQGSFTAQLPSGTRGAGGTRRMREEHAARQLAMLGPSGWPQPHSKQEKVRLKLTRRRSRQLPATAADAHTAFPGPVYTLRVLSWLIPHNPTQQLSRPSRTIVEEDEPESN